MKKLLSSLLAVSSALMLSACGNQTKQVHRHSPKQHTEKIIKKNVNYRKPSQNKPYPKSLNANDNRILVSINNQRAYIQQRHNQQWRNIYIMYASTGSHNRTPRGNYKINGVKTNWFYSPTEHEGAQYGTGWHDGGVYLFHATPANQHHQIMKNVAKDLGKKPSSHGCVHLTIPDAKYIEQYAPKGMKVLIK